VVSVKIAVLRWFPCDTRFPGPFLSWAALELESLSTRNWYHRRGEGIPPALPKLRYLEVVEGILFDSDLLQFLLATSSEREDGATESSLRSLKLETQRHLSPGGIEAALSGSKVSCSIRSLSVEFHPMQQHDIRQQPSIHSFPSMIFNSCFNLHSFTLLSPIPLNCFINLPRQLRTLTLTVAGQILLEELEAFLDEHVTHPLDLTIRVRWDLFDPTCIEKVRRLKGLSTLSIVPYGDPNLNVEQLLL